MENYPFATNPGPNIRTARSPKFNNEWEEREALSIFRLNGLAQPIPLLWRGCTNELVHKLNSFKQENDIEIQDKLKIVIYGVTEQQWLAFTCETFFIMQECNLLHFKCSQKTIKSGYSLVVDEYRVSDKVYTEPIELKLKIIEKKEKIYLPI